MKDCNVLIYVYQNYFHFFTDIYSKAHFISTINDYKNTILLLLYIRKYQKYFLFCHTFTPKLFSCAHLMSMMPLCYYILEYNKSICIFQTFTPKLISYLHLKTISILYYYYYYILECIKSIFFFYQCIVPNLFHVYI